MAVATHMVDTHELSGLEKAVFLIALGEDHRSIDTNHDKLTEGFCRPYLAQQEQLDHVLDLDAYTAAHKSKHCGKQEGQGHKTGDKKCRYELNHMMIDATGQG